MWCTLTWMCFFSLIAYVSSTLTSVQTQYGTAHGRSLTTINRMLYVAFYSIPYGEPPLAERRFMPPVKWTNKWNVARDFRHPGPVCPTLDIEPITSRDFESLSAFDSMVGICYRHSLYIQPIA